MKVFKFASALVILASAMVMVSPNVYAETSETAAVSPANAVSSIITNLESTLVEVAKSDFAAATIKVKAARGVAEAIANDSPALKKGYASLIQAQIQVKNGNVEKATQELNKVIALYKAI